MNQVEQLESSVSQHYTDANLMTRIFERLEASGVALNELQLSDLAPVDEFHIGGRQATEHAVSKMNLKSTDHVVDIGCGIGGASRYIGSEFGCHVNGIDLTPEYIAIAWALTELTGLDDKVDFEVASALAMPFEDEVFDAAISFHMAMNVKDRVGLYHEAARVLKPGAIICIYDVMIKGEEELSFPLPWAQSAETSHLVTPEEMRELLSDAGFEVCEIEDRSAFAKDFFSQTLSRGAKGHAPLGIHLILGESAREKFLNTFNGIERGCIGPVQIIAKKNG